MFGWRRDDVRRSPALNHVRFIIYCIRYFAQIGLCVTVDHLVGELASVRGSIAQLRGSVGHVCGS